MMRSFSGPLSALAVVFATMCGVVACNPLAPASPSDADVVAALSSDLVVDSHVEECTAGKDGEDPVQVCKFCVVEVTVASPRSFREGERLAARRSYHSAVFKRAVSLDQPDVAPGPGVRGVWVMSSRRGVEGSIRTTSTMPREFSDRLGYRGPSGFGAMMSQGSIPRGVLATLKENAELRKQFVDVVGSCRTPEVRAMPPRPPAPAEAAPSDPAAVAPSDPAAAPPPPPAAPAAAPTDLAVAKAAAAAAAVPTFTVQPYTPARTLTPRETGSRYRSAPLATPETPTIGATVAGEPLTVTGRVMRPDGVWYRVRLKDGQTAYLRGDLVVGGTP